MLLWNLICNLFDFRDVFLCFDVRVFFLCIDNGRKENIEREENSCIT